MFGGRRGWRGPGDGGPGSGRAPAAGRARPGVRARSKNAALGVRTVLPGVRAVAALALLAGVATGAGSDVRASVGPAARDPWPELEMRELSPKEWLRRVQEKLSEKYQVDPAELRFSPAPPKLAAF